MQGVWRARLRGCTSISFQQVADAGRGVRKRKSDRSRHVLRPYCSLWVAVHSLPHFGADRKIHTTGRKQAYGHPAARKTKGTGNSVNLMWPRTCRSIIICCSYAQNPRNMCDLLLPCNGVHRIQIFLRSRGNRPSPRRCRKPPPDINKPANPFASYTIQKDLMQLLYLAPG